jgi:hypothetical protein
VGASTLASTFNPSEFSLNIQQAFSRNLQKSVVMAYQSWGFHDGED